MGQISKFFMIASTLALSACGNANNQQAEDVALDPIERGRQLFRECAICHDARADGRHRAGPNLYGIVGAPVAAQDFNYSKALKAYGGVWSEARLDAFIENPKQLIPRSRMSYSGQPNAETRALIIQYLLSTAPPATTAEPTASAADQPAAE